MLARIIPSVYNIRGVAKSRILHQGDNARYLAETDKRMGRPINLVSRYLKMLTKAGFTEVHIIKKKWPNL